MADEPLVAADDAELPDPEPLPLPLPLPDVAAPDAPEPADGLALCVPMLPEDATFDFPDGPVANTMTSAITITSARPPPIRTPAFGFGLGRVPRCCPEPEPDPEPAL